MLTVLPLKIDLALLVSISIVQIGANQLKVCSFNVGEIREETMKNNLVMNIYAKVLRKYDLCWIEVNTKHHNGEEFLTDLVTTMNNHDFHKQIRKNTACESCHEAPYKMIAREVLEDLQFGFIYNTETISTGKFEFPPATQMGQSEDGKHLQPPVALEIIPVTDDKRAVPIKHFWAIGVHIGNAAPSKAVLGLMTIFKQLSDAHNFNDSVIMGNMKDIDNLKYGHLLAEHHQQLGITPANVPSLNCIASNHAVGHHDDTEERICVVGPEITKHAKNEAAWDYIQDFKITKDKDLFSKSLPVEITIG